MVSTFNIFMHTSGVIFIFNKVVHLLLPAILENYSVEGMGCDNTKHNQQ